MDIQGVTSFGDSGGPVYGQQNSLGQDEFMNLLLTELSYQDPMNPMDNKEMTAQLTQFSSLERLSSIDTSLNELLAFQKSLQNATIPNMIGRTVGVSGDSVYLKDTAELVFRLQDGADSVMVNIYDAEGKLVRNEELGPVSEGEIRYAWDGEDNLGNGLEEGSYSYEIEALDANGNPVAHTTKGSGRVTDIIFEDGVTGLVLDGNRRIYLSEIQSIGE